MVNDNLQTYPLLQPGEIIGGKYRIVEPIGEGGMSFVVSAIHLDLGEKVAIKILRPELMENEEIVHRFTREARAAVRIKSEHVAHIIDVGNLLDGTPYIVMEYLNGEDLYSLILENGPIPVEKSVEYILQACEAIATAHASGIVHRDIKPENLFIIKLAKNVEVIKVLDFGISKVALTGTSFDPDTSLIKTTVSIGTPVYMSPEQIRGEKEVDNRTDIWSLGCVLYELITGVPSFGAPSLFQLSAIILEKDPKYNQLIPLDLYSTVILRCLAKDPKDRFENIAELAIALYPFGTRKAQILVERCCNILNLNSKFYSTINPKKTWKDHMFFIGTILMVIISVIIFILMNGEISQPIPNNKIINERQGTTIVEEVVPNNENNIEKEEIPKIKEEIVTIPKENTSDEKRPAVTIQKKKNISKKQLQQQPQQSQTPSSNQKEIDVGF